MNNVIEQEQQESEQDLRPSFFQVWFDLRFGVAEPDWWWNSEPQPLASALDECAELRAAGWVCRLLPEGINPRSDGRWDNP